MIRNDVMNGKRMTDIKKLKTEQEDDDTQSMRQIGISSLNESVQLLSTFADDDLEKQSKLALSLLQQVRQNNGK
ncbi:MAG: hypothetical protein QCI00_10065 [Candidatus Thermoplasmatota archaeon]|nr:hypothetical protein [Candidatus Thermoplasmatota archaeon]